MSNAAGPAATQAAGSSGVALLALLPVAVVLWAGWQHDLGANIRGDYRALLAGLFAVFALLAGMACLTAVVGWLLPFPVHRRSAYLAGAVLLVGLRWRMSWAMLGDAAPRHGKRCARIRAGRSCWRAPRPSPASACGCPASTTTTTPSP